ncbi:MAG: DEAD/DEAH box helicase family protein [Selenomonadaceae bacterium]|nr:DEAD/DEAH box helicase family protein [Selenomonadaceae bacterium]
MKINLLPFQLDARRNLRDALDDARDMYSRRHKPQIVSFTANTGAGKTIILISLVESIYRGDENYPAQRNAIFVWLSDSPELNEQSRQKFAEHADEFIGGKLVTIDDETFDAATLDDGKIYFLNTQKLSKTSNLTRHGDRRRFTIWETLQRTAETKFDRLYLIIDEAHRGARNVKEQLTVMQKFIKGSVDDGLSPLPVTVGVSATIERFNELVKNSGAAINPCAVPVDDVRKAGLLKDRIIVIYPDEDERDMSMLHAATLNWLDRCKAWRRHEVKPIFIVQVQSGTGNKISDTNLDECLKVISDAADTKFQVGEVVHTFGDETTLTLNGLNVVYREPSKISADDRIKVVLFKESLSTGWDCPRAETMMSFRRAVDATYIAQLIGRMIRTPLHKRITDDETLNEVQLFLPQFDRETVKQILDELQTLQLGSVTQIDAQSSGEKKFQTLTIRPQVQSDIDREEIFNFINGLGLPTYRINGRRRINPLTALFELARLLTWSEIYHDALDEVINAFVEKIRAHVDELKASGDYDSAVERIRNVKINADVIDLERNKTYGASENLFSSLETDTDRQFEAAKKKFGDDTVANTYRRRYNDATDADVAKIDVILFAADPARIDALQKSADKKFRELADKYRREFARAGSAYQDEYNRIVSSSSEVSKHNFSLPEVITMKYHDDSREFDNHLFVDATTGTARIKLDGWELGVLSEEQRRADFVCWLRNVDRKDWALSLVYADEHHLTRNFYPDMLIVRKTADGYVVDVLEPHDSTRRDNLGKAKALANYAAENPTVGRVELIRGDRNFFRRLDMSRADIREKVLSAKSNAELDDIFSEH